jgi:hypothetical protein
MLKFEQNFISGLYLNWKATFVIKVYTKTGKLIFCFGYTLKLEYKFCVSVYDKIGIQIYTSAIVIWKVFIFTNY